MKLCGAQLRPVAGNVAANADVFQQRSDAHDITIGLGLPLAVDSGVRIAMVWFAPWAGREVYAKQLLHADERPYFVAGDGQLVLRARGGTERVTTGSCARLRR